MYPSKKYGTGYSQCSESRFLSSFSQSKSDRSGEPISKKPKLDIAKNLNTPKPISNVCNKKDDTSIDDTVWGVELDCAEIAQVEHDEVIALSQMTQSTQSIAVQANPKVVSKEVHQEFNVKKTATSDVKNTSRVPFRRFGSSQWPSTSTSISSHSSNAEIGKGPANVAFLHSDLEKLRLENKRIKEELNKKAGEAKILRDKVNNFEKEKDRIRREYSTKMETLKAEAVRNSSNLKKEIRSLSGQLDVKNMEIKTAERRVQISSSVNRIQPDSPNRLGASFRSPQVDSSPESELNGCLWRAREQGLPLKFLRDLVVPELLEPSQPEAPVSESARSCNPRLFSGVLGTEGGSMLKNRCAAVRKESLAAHTSVSQCATLLLSPSLVDITSDYAHQLISQALEVCHKILLELLKQLESALCSNNRFMERERELLMSGCQQVPLDREYDLVSHRELYSDERGIPARRALGLMSVLVQESSFTAKKILSSSPKESTDVLDIVRNIVRQVEKQRRTLKFQGVLAGSVALIKDLLRSGTAISVETQSLMVDTLRWVVSARPGSLVLRNTLQALLAAERFPHITNSLCHNSAEKTYKEIPHHSIIQFTPDSCVIQVLCSLLKAAKTPMKYKLTDLLTLWMMSVLNDKQSRPHWLTVDPKATSCQCNALVCKLCFTLLSETCFSYPTVSASGEDVLLVNRVLCRGVLVVNFFMDDNDYLLALVDPYSLGSYEHFLQFMTEVNIDLEDDIKDTLAFLLTQDESLKQSNSKATDVENPQLNTALNDVENPQLNTALNLLTMGQNGKNSPDVFKYLDSL